MYCVYITFYKGNKLPPFYIGSSTVKRIEKGYRGSVASTRYKTMWKYELEANPHLFKTSIISRHKNRNDALTRELIIQESLGVVRNPLYCNLSTARENGFFGRDVSGKLNPMYGKEHPNRGKKYDDDYKKKLAASVSNSWTDERKAEWSKRISGENNPMYGYEPSEEYRNACSERYSGKGNPMYGKTHSEETRRKISDKSKGRPVTQEAKEKISTAMKGRLVSDKTREKQSKSLSGRKFSDESKKKMSDAKKNQPRHTCEHCGKTIASSQFKVYHGDNCKLRRSS